jgi:hypothetical protein
MWLRPTRLTVRIRWLQSFPTKKSQFVSQLTSHHCEAPGTVFISFVMSASAFCSVSLENKKKETKKKAKTCATTG